MISTRHHDFFDQLISGIPPIFEEMAEYAKSLHDRGRCFMCVQKYEMPRTCANHQSIGICYSMTVDANPDVYSPDQPSIFCKECRFVLKCLGSKGKRVVFSKSVCLVCGKEYL